MSMLYNESALLNKYAPLIRMKMDGMSQREIALALGVSDATMSRIFQRLKDSIKTKV